ncbi:hypothetical protein KCP73_23795 [Salmonella enterica subsp. enterica]|nr:hypothetical protein KCP73_23795 [Salmonella enterica subsp. enterica]
MTNVALTAVRSLHCSRSPIGLRWIPAPGQPPAAVLKIHGIEKPAYTILAMTVAPTKVKCKSSTIPSPYRKDWIPSV